MIYLAAPIDTKNDGWVADLWRMEAHRSLEEAGWGVYDPSEIYWPGVYGGVGPGAKVIYEGNQKALKESDGVLALLPPGVRTIGTPMEIEFARANGKPVVVVAEDASMSLSGAGIEIYSMRFLKVAIRELVRMI